MKSNSLTRLALAALLTVCLGSNLYAIKDEKNQGRWEKPCKSGPDAVVPGFLVNMGPTGARGILKAKSFVVKFIFPKSPAEGVLKLNDEEWPVLAGLLEIETDLPAGLGFLMDRYGLSLIALTCGPRGSLLFTPDEIDRLEGQAVRIADTVGAGDAFTGALAVGLLKGLPIPSIHRHAARVAAYVCTQSGATPRLPDDLISEGGAR